MSDEPPTLVAGVMLLLSIEWLELLVVLALVAVDTALELRVRGMDRKMLMEGKGAAGTAGGYPRTIW